MGTKSKKIAGVLILCLIEHQGRGRRDCLWSRMIVFDARREIERGWRRGGELAVQLVHRRAIVGPCRSFVGSAGRFAPGDRVSIWLGTSRMGMRRRKADALFRSAAKGC